MTLPQDDDEIRRWVADRLAALDNAPRDKRWKANALGMPVHVAFAAAPREYRVDFRVPVGEMRVLNDVAKARGIGTRSYVKRAVATALVCDGIPSAEIPVLTGPGLLGP